MAIGTFEQGVTRVILSSRKKISSYLSKNAGPVNMSKGIVTKKMKLLSSCPNFAANLDYFRIVLKQFEDRNSFLVNFPAQDQS